MTLDRAPLFLVMLLPLAALTSACDKDKAAGDGPAMSATASAMPMVVASAMPSAMPSALASAMMKGDHRPGVASMFFRAARDIDLKDAQKPAVDKAEEPLKADDPEMKAEFKATHADLIAGVKAGKIDAAAMSKHYAAIDKAAQTRTDTDAMALNGLYAALEPAQRKTLVAAIRTKQSEREAKAAAREHDKHDMMDAGADEWVKKRLEHLTKDLDLDAAQQKSIGAIIAKGDHPTPAMMEMHKTEGKKRMDALLAAFEGDGFDAKKLELNEAPKKAHEMMDHQVQFLTQLTPILKPEQREKMAGAMDHPQMGGGMDHPQMGGMMGRRPGGPGGPGGGMDDDHEHEAE